MSRIKRRQAGFTLIEILVVVVILGILAALVVPQVFGRIDDARITKAKSDIRAIETALNLFRMDNFKYPTTDQGLESLVKQPTDPNIRNWKQGGYLQSGNLKDPREIITSTSSPARAAESSTSSRWAPTIRKAAKVRTRTSGTGTGMIRTKPSGFTLIEILVVIVIIAVMVSVSMLSMNVMVKDSEIEAESRRLAGLIGMVREQAEMQGRDYGLRFSDTAYEFVSYTPRTDEWARRRDDPLLNRARCPPA